MPYTTNPYLPKLRAQAVEMVVQGQGIRQVARYIGVNPSTVSRWCKKAPLGGTRVIPTESSRPHHHPKELDKDIVKRIVEIRSSHGRCAEVVHRHLLVENIDVSLSSVKRTLDRKHLTKKRSPWKRYHKSTERPEAEKPGDLVQLDTIHLMESENSRIYVYTLIDLYSRWTYARAVKKLGGKQTISFVKKADKKFPYSFECLQSDNGPEFSTHFTERIKINHRHSRIRKPNDNAHIERFNRTIQEELLDKLPHDVDTINRYLPKYLKYYNEERLHMGIDFKTPSQMLI
ncbi:MAG: DDE-type integrase/transposase/recombinase [Parcubacteria group bacterium]|jgi:transposase InsO family protein